ncbi:hypothetical protein BDN67DRAFT_1008087 [Paxillus ammoniavirescens]|nr:hypothetical protein BDN67DRAFT_1008087 [Paxillus ammoniavirescens]
MGHGQNCQLALERKPQRTGCVQNPLLVKYHPTDALKRLKEWQLKLYAKGMDPYDRQIRDKKESTVDWWPAMQQDEDVDVIGALTLKIFSAVLVSMADKHTNVHHHMARYPMTQRTSHPDQPGHQAEDIDIQLSTSFTEKKTI